MSESKLETSTIFILLRFIFWIKKIALEESGHTFFIQNRKNNQWCHYLSLRRSMAVLRGNSATLVTHLPGPQFPINQTSMCFLRNLSFESTIMSRRRFPTAYKIRNLGDLMLRRNLWP